MIEWGGLWDNRGGVNLLERGEWGVLEYFCPLSFAPGLQEMSS